MDPERPSSSPMDRSGAVPPELPRVPCRACGGPIDSSDAYCRYCGQRQREGAWPTGRDRSGDAWYYGPLPILVLGLTVLGALALPLVWRSNRMSPATKWVIGVVLVVYTVAVVYLGYLMVDMTYRHLQRALDPFGPL